MNKISVKTADREQAMVPMIYGHFVEFMRDCIDEGMWAQLLKNRGFDKRKEIPAGVVDGNPDVAENWCRTGYKNTFEIDLDTDASLARDGYAQKIRCYNDYDGYVGIAQEHLFFDRKKYNGYLWMKSVEHAKVKIVLRDMEDHIISKQEFQVEKYWHKYEFDFTPEIQTRNGVFEIRLLGEGTLWLDSASIMPADHVDGIWCEVYAQIEGLCPPVIRYPGGCFADSYHFEDGLGAIDHRPYRMNRHWGGFVDNSFGTDEYIKFCRNLGCEPMICINFGSGTPEEAANWVEYCNGSADTPYGSLRALNGNPEPYHIKYWDVGNEIFGEWEIGHSNAGEYAKKYLSFYQAMKAKDDSIVMMACGGDGDCSDQQWNEIISKQIKDKMDAVCLHMYALKSMEGRKHDNTAVYYAVTGAVKKYEKILLESYHTVNRHSDKNIRLAVTEYNLGTIIDSYREQTLEAAVFNAGMLNMFIRNSEKLLMCNYSDLVNGWPGGCIVSKNGQAFGTANYYVLQLYAAGNLNKVLDVTVDSPVYHTKEQIGNIEPLSDVPYLDIAAGVNDQEQLVLFVVNRCLEEPMYLDLGLEMGRVEITEINAEKTSDINSFNEQRIYPQTRVEELRNGMLLVKPHSINRIIRLGMEEA